METTLSRPPKVSKSYSTNELEVLFQLLKNGHRKEYFIKNLIYQLKQALDPTYGFETTIFNRYLPPGMYQDQEPYGESIYFVIFHEHHSTLHFNFCSRHLNNFLYRATLREMPLLINTYFIGTFAKWRLQIGK